jgi:Flp pilus assembly protein TadG
MSVHSNQLTEAEIASKPVAESGLTVITNRSEARGRLLSTFARDQHGGTAIIFGLTMFPVVFFVGVAVDFSKALTVRSQSQVALDAAALAAGRAFMTSTASTDTEKFAAAKTAAENYWAAAKPKSVMQAYKANGAADSGLTFIEPTGGTTEFTVKATTWIKTPFLSAAEAFKKKQAPGTDPSVPVGCQDSGWRCMKVVSTAGAIVATSGSNTGYSIETSLMLDVTGSMGPDYGDGKKMDDMKLAAKDLVDILVWNGQDSSSTTSKIALIPFSESVNLGDLAEEVTGLSNTGSYTSSTRVCSGSGRNRSCWWETSTNTGTLRPCAMERLGPNQYTDEPPSATNGWMGSHGATNAPSGYSYSGGIGGSSANYNASGTCDSGSPDTAAAMVPLSNDKDKLKTTIEALAPTGGTGGHLGTAWAWYALSPNWNGIWPSTGQAAAYNSASTKKIAVLMTDGDYNTDYTPDITSGTQSDTLCTNMKAKGITVYTVGFQVSSSAQTRLQNCATSTAHYYNATSGDALKQAFRDIALKVASLRISK